MKLKQSILVDRRCAGCHAEYKEIADFDGYDEFTGKPNYALVSDCCSACIKAHHDNFVDYMIQNYGLKF